MLQKASDARAGLQRRQKPGASLGSPMCVQRPRHSNHLLLLSQILWQGRWNSQDSTGTQMGYQHYRWQLKQLSTTSAHPSLFRNTHLVLGREDRAHPPRSGCGDRVQAPKAQQGTSRTLIQKALQDEHTPGREGEVPYQRTHRNYGSHCGSGIFYRCHAIFASSIIRKQR